MNDAELERRFLDFVFTTDAVITTGAVAYFTRCTLKEADELLDRLTSTGMLRIENDDHGEIYYVYPKRPKPMKAMAAAGQAGAAVSTAAGGALVPAMTHPSLTRTTSGKHLNPGTAAVLSLLFPGAGQMYSGRVGAGLGWMFLTFAGYVALVFPGLILHVWGIFSAASHAREENKRNGY